MAHGKEVHLDDNIQIGELYPWQELRTSRTMEEEMRGFELCTHAVMRESLSLFHFCSAVNCSNVTHETVKAPKFINAKRKAKGEPPLYEYRILTVDVRPRHETTGEPTGRHHASPRQHIRRGHIRHYKSGKNVWVQQMMVGDPARGRVDKDYEIRKGV
jgi:hypothetical protein